jgi:hypothetical protein
LVLPSGGLLLFFCVQLSTRALQIALTHWPPALETEANRAEVPLQRLIVAHQ